VWLKEFDTEEKQSSGLVSVPSIRTGTHKSWDVILNAPSYERVIKKVRGEAGRRLQS
jgi:hypothetical protein